MDTSEIVVDLTTEMISAYHTLVFRLRRWVSTGRCGALRRDERGAAAIEFALLLPVLLLLFFGIVQFGLLFSVHSTMQNASREAARAVALLGDDDSGGELSAEDALGPWRSLPINVQVCSGTGAACGGLGDQEVRVVLSIPMRDAVFVDPFGIFRNMGNLVASTSMRQE